MGVAGSSGSSSPDEDRAPPEQQAPAAGMLKGHGASFMSDASWARGWKNLLSSFGGTLLGLERALAGRNPLKRESGSVVEKLPQLAKEGAERTLPQCISLFLPEFPVQPPMGQRQLKILGFVAKGSFGTVLKVLDCGQEKVFAVKVLPKVEVLRRDSLKQCKEEVSIQCAHIAALGICTPFGSRWGVLPKPSSASLLRSWSWCLATSTIWASSTGMSRWKIFFWMNKVT